MLQSFSLSESSRLTPGITSHIVDELTSSDHTRCYTSRVILWYELIHSMWYSPPDQVTFLTMCISLNLNSYVLKRCRRKTDTYILTTKAVVSNLNLRVRINYMFIQLIIFYRLGHNTCNHFELYEVEYILSGLLFESVFTYRRQVN